MIKPLRYLHYLQVSQSMPNKQLLTQVVMLQAAEEPLPIR